MLPHPRAVGPGEPPPLPRIGSDAIASQTVAQIVQARAMAAGFGRHDLGGHSLERGALTTGMDRGIPPAKLKRLVRHESFDVRGEYLEFGDLFEGHPSSGGVVVAHGSCASRSARLSRVRDREKACKPAGQGAHSRIPPLSLI